MRVCLMMIEQNHLVYFPYMFGKMLCHCSVVLGFCYGCPDGLELSPGQSTGSRWTMDMDNYGQLQALVENVFVLGVPVQLAQ